MTENNQSIETVEVLGNENPPPKSNIFAKVISFLGKITYYIVLVVVVALLIFNAYSVFANKVLKQQVPKMFGYAYQLVLTDSMKGDNPDSFPGHSLIVIKEQENYEVNDIVTFSTKSKITTTHRIVGYDGNYFITKGDFNNTADLDPLPPENIHGKVIWHSTFLGKFLVYIRQPIGIIVLLGLGFLMLYLPSVGNKKESPSK